MEEQHAIALLKAHDLTGLEALVDRYYLQAVRAADLIVRDTAQAEDIVQAAFLHASEKIDQLASDRFGPWFMKMVVNAALKSAQKQQRLVPLTAEDDPESQPLADWLIDRRPAVEELVETAELRQSIWQALARLTPRQRAAVVLKYYLDMSEVEVSQALQAPRPTIKWWLYTAREKLRHWLRLTDAPHAPFEPESVSDHQEKE